MSVSFPQYDLPTEMWGRVSGASDLWDNDTGGDIISADYFAALLAAYAMFYGVDSIDALYYGTSPVSKAYFGSTQVWG